VPNQFTPYHLILSWDGGQFLHGRLLGELSVELVDGAPEALANYGVPLTFDPDDPTDAKGLLWLKAKCKAAVQARAGVDPTNGGT
jgi:hypothetical protein